MSKIGPTDESLVSGSSFSRLGIAEKAVAAAAIVGVIGLATTHAFVGWYPLDDGVLGLSAMLVQDGHWPHVDFVDPYSGGLSLFNAAWMTAFGNDLALLRIPFLAGLAGTSWLVWRLSRSYVSEWLSIALGFVSFAVPFVFFRVPMPTWYTTFLTVFAVYLTVQARTLTSRRLFIVGLVIGVAIAVKITALYVACGFAAWLISRSAWQGRRAAAVLFALAPTAVLRNLDAPTVLFLAAPLVAAAALLYQLPTNESSPNLGLRRIAWFAVGGLVVPSVALATAALSGHASLLVDSLIIGPLRARVDLAARPVPALSEQAIAAASLLLPIGICRLQLRHGRVLMAAVAVGIGVLPILHSRFVEVLFAMMNLALVVMAAMTLRKERVRPEVSLGIAIAATAAVVGYPYYSFVYSLYVFPLIVVAMAGWGSTDARAPALLGSWVLMVAAMSLVLAVSGRADGAGGVSRVRVEWVPLSSDLATLSVPHGYGVWNDLTELLEERSAAGAIWAGPESPEVYALIGQTSPLLHTYEFLEPVPVFVEGFAESLVDRGVCTVVINRTGIPVTSPPDGEVYRELTASYPSEALIEAFEIRWRNDDACHENGATETVEGGSWPSKTS